MAMGVILRSDGNGPDSAVNYSLQAREIQINLSRSPMQSPLPGGDPLLLDLGQCYFVFLLALWRTVYLLYCLYMIGNT